MKRILHILLFSFVFVISVANVYSPVFKNFTIDNGLSHSYVRCIENDRYGFMWFGTFDGLNRFDGINFKVFRHNPNDPNSICSNSISALYCDQDNILWVGTTNGLNKMLPGTNRFSRTYMANARDSGKVPIGLYVTTILQDKNQQLYIGAYASGLLKYSAKNDVFTVVPFQTPDGEIKTDYTVLAATFDRQNRMFLGISGYGLCMLDKEGRIILLNDSITSFSSMHVNDRLYIGNESGLYCYNEGNNSFDWPIQIPKINSAIHHLFTDDKGILWIATETRGIILYNPQTKELGNIKSGYNNESLSSSSIYYIFQDRQKGFWIGTMRGGVEYWDPGKPQFYSVQNKLGNSPTLNFVNTFVELDNDILWVGTDGSGIQQFDKKQMVYTKNPELEKLNGISGKAIICMLKDQDGNIWIGSYGNGLTKYNLKTGHTDHYEVNTNGLKSNYIWAIFESKKGTIWIGCLNMSFLMHYNKINNLFISDLDSINGVIALNETYDEKLLIGTYDGYWIYDPVTHNSQKDIINISVRAIHVDKDSNIWLGTEGGGLKKLHPGYSMSDIDPEMKKIKNANIMAIQEDDRQNLWISTNNGLYCFNYKTGQTISYNKADGLQSNQFIYSSAIKTSDNKMFFGGINGVTVFDPDLFQPRKKAVNLQLVDIKIMNKSVRDENLKYLFPGNIPGVRKITLPYNKAYLNFEFIAISYANPEKIEYAYILDGFEANWNHVGNKREANYINLPPGKYTFKVKASSNEGILNEQGIKVAITILPPLWKTWWAYLFYVFAIAFAYIKYRNFAVKQIHAKKEQELDQLKLSFFINVSHEFRTPLTIMLTPLEKIQKSDNIDDIHDLAKIIRQSTGKLLNTVNQLLDFRKIDMGKSTLYLKNLDLVKFIDESISIYKELAKEKQIDLKLEYPSQKVFARVDTDKFEKIIANLLSNALKFTSQGGCVTIGATKKTITIPVRTFNFRKKPKSEEYAEIKVSDTGVGMTKEHIRNIFERFYQVDKTNPGTGIGLNYVKSLIELHGGEILIESEYGKGSTFIVRLPLGDEQPKSKSIDIEGDDTYNSINTSIEQYALLYDLRNMDSSVEGKDDIISDRAEKRVILIVEDNKTLRAQIRSELTGTYNVKEAANGVEGLEKAKKYIPDLIVSDILMPRMDGIEMCKRIKEDLEVCHIPVIILTAKGTLEDKIEGYEKGADEYLPKPFHMALLSTRIKNLIQSRITLREKFESSKTFIPAKDFTLNNLDETFIERATKIVLDNIEDTGFSLADFYKEFGMSRSVFFHKISSLTGLNPVNFIRSVRLKHAAGLLLQNSVSVKEISYLCGFNSPAYFVKSFREFYGQTPKEFVNNYFKQEGDNN